MRGGSWNNNPRNLRSANRNRNTADNRNNNNGFRVARTLPAGAGKIMVLPGVLPKRSGPFMMRAAGAAASTTMAPALASSEAAGAMLSERIFAHPLTPRPSPDATTDTTRVVEKASKRGPSTRRNPSGILIIIGRLH
ncbi:MAG: hypothetical protein F9K38_14375 [Pseudorhodoplanes sp.]|nr:MAG: hypothetical protein F9K38_14375 [Pseudorhodoplanes sp.]